MPYEDLSSIDSAINFLNSKQGMNQDIKNQMLNQLQQRRMSALQSSLPNPGMINNMFNVAAGNLSQRGYQARGRAQSDAAAMAGSRGLLNPSAFIQGSGNRAFSPFADALGGLEERRAMAQTQLPYQNLQALLPFLQMVQQQNQFQQGLDQNQAGFFDYLGAVAPLLAAPFTGGTSLLGYLFGKK